MANRLPVFIASLIGLPCAALASDDAFPSTLFSTHLPWALLLALALFCLVRARRGEREALARVRRESEARFRQLAELLPETVFEIDLDGRLTFANRRAFEVFQYSREQFDQGLCAFDFIAPADRDRARANIALSLAGQKSHGEEYTAVARDGSRFPVMIFSSPLNIDERPAGLCGLMIDLRSVKEAEERRLSDRKLEAVRMIAGGIAHDFNNILQGISGRIEHCIGRGELKENDQAALMTVERACERASRLVRQLLVFADKGAGEPRPFDLNDLIGEFAALAGRTFASETELKLELASDLRHAHANPEKVEQILYNLLVGAEEAAHGGKIRIETTNLGGMEEEPAVRILFESNAPESDAVPPAWTSNAAGIGVAIVQSLVEDAGGRLGFLPADEAPATRLLIDLPAAR